MARGSTAALLVGALALAVGGAHALEFDVAIGRTRVSLAGGAAWLVTRRSEGGG
jgi:hypothetical protein